MCFFEFHPFHCLVKDVRTQEILLRRHTHEWLYRFFPTNDKVTQCAVLNAEMSSSKSEFHKTEPFELWINDLGICHPRLLILFCEFVIYLLKEISFSYM